MRQETKQNKRFKRNISYILIMALCIVSLSCGVCEADEAWIWNNAPSAEYINTDETNYGKITQNRDGTYYKLYRLDGRVADDFLFGYYSVKLHILTKLDSNEDIQVTAYKNDYYTYDGINIEWNYSGKIKKDMEFYIGLEASEEVFIQISGPENMRYKFNVRFHKANNWEFGSNNRIYDANAFDVNNTIHGSTCMGEPYIDFDYFEMEIPSQGIITFEMDRTPKSNHTIMIYDSNKKQIWKTKATLESHVSSKEIKVKPQKIYIKIFGTNTDRYDFKIAHKQTTNIPNKPKIIESYKLNKGFKVTWNNPGGIFSGYQFQYARDKKFNYNVTSKWIGGKKTNKITISGLERNRVYFCRIRTFNKVNNKMYYSAWSDVDTAFTKY